MGGCTIMQDSAGAHLRWRLPDFLLPDPVRFRTNGGDGDGDGGSGDGGGDGGGDPGGQQQNDPPSGGGDGNTLSAEDARKLRSEARNLRSRLKDAEAERDKLRTAQQSDTERLQEQNSSLSTKNADLVRENRNLRAQVVAGRVGIVDPELAANLIDWDDADDDSALEKQFNAILKARPYLAGNVAGGADGTSRGGGSGGGGNESEDMNTLLRRRAGVIQ